MIFAQSISRFLAKRTQTGPCRTPVDRRPGPWLARFGGATGVHFARALAFRRSRRRTPGPPPFSSMNTTPAPSSALRIAPSFAAVSAVCPSESSARRMVLTPRAVARARSATLHLSKARPGSDLGTGERWLPRFVQMDLFSEDVCWRRKARKKGHFDTPRGERYAGLLQRILHRCDGFLRYNPSFALKIDHRRQPKPSHSYAELTDVLIAAYCPAVANMANLTVSERWRRMRQFDTILQQQLAANMMPPGSLVIANVPLPPAVYRTLRAQAAASGQAPAQLMAAILSRAAGN
jgi:hypothetical protein